MMDPAARSRPIRRPRFRVYGPLIAAVLILMAWIPPGAALEVPALQGRVNDYAGMLRPATRQQLETSLAAFETAESTQIVVLTVASLEGASIEDFAIRVAEQWKIGHAGADNGAILVVARQDRKLRIEVGYGLEGKLTDLVAGRIIRSVIVPAFKAGDFDGGIAAGVNAMLASVKGEFQAPPRRRTPGARGMPLQGWLLPLLAFVFLITQLGRVRRGLGTVAGGLLLPVFGGMFWGGGLLILLALIPVGLLAGFVLSLIGAGLPMAAGGRRSVSRGTYWGGFGGGGFGGGGFSGGGGGFGGGGASGSW